MRTTNTMSDSEKHSTSTPLVSWTSEASETRQVSRFITWLGMSGCPVLILIGLRAAWTGDWSHAQVLFLFALLFAGNESLFRLTGRAAWHRNSLIAAVLILFGFLISTGGQSNTGPLWFYVFLPMAFFITGLRAGAILVGAGVAFALMVFMVPSLPWVTTTYGPDFQLRFIASVLFASVFSGILDYQRRKAKRELYSTALLYEHAAKTDEMTDLPNRRAMIAELNREWSRYERAGHHFSVVLLDLDYFKTINDRYGHDAGDRVLETFADLLKTTCRDCDLASRWGGEEFMVLLPDTALLEALSLAERMRRNTEEAVIIHENQRIPITLSAGVSSVTKAGSLEALLKQVDNNLYLSKELGRNCITPGVRQDRQEQEESDQTRQKNDPQLQ